MGIIIVPELVACAIVGTNVYAMTTGNSKMHVVDASNPAAMVESIFYQLNAGAFAVNQKDPSAIVARAAANRVYVQNASEGLPAAMVLAAYNVSNPLVVTQVGSPAPLSFGTNLFIAANGCNGLALNGSIIYSLLGGDRTTTPAQLNAVNSATLAVIGGPVLVGTFNDHPIKVFYVDDTVYVLSGLAGANNQKVFIYDVSNQAVAPVFTGSFNITDTDAVTDGVSAFFVNRDNDTISITTGGGAVDVHLLIYTTGGTFLGKAYVSGGISQHGTAMVQAA